MLRLVRSIDKAKSLIWKGSILSKFDNTPDDIERLGLFFKHQFLGNFMPKFVVTREIGSAEEFAVSVIF
jgi:hypothetical protein